MCQDVHCKGEEGGSSNAWEGDYESAQYSWIQNCSLLCQARLRLSKWCQTLYPFMTAVNNILMLEMQEGCNSATHFLHEVVVPRQWVM